MRIGTFVAAVVCVAMPGLGWGQDLARFDPSVGVGGYTGATRKLEDPVTLRWRPRDGIVGTVESVTVTAGHPTERFVTVFTGSMSVPPQGGIKRRFAVSELTTDGRSITAAEPLVIVESWSDEQGGNVANLLVSFPGFALRGLPVPTPGTPQFQVWRDLFAADLAYAEAPIAAGSEVFDRASYHRLLEEQVRAFLGGEAVISENTFATRAHSIVRSGSKRFLLARLSGRITAHSGTNRLTMVGAGYGLIDLASGLSTGTSRTEIVARQAGREARRTVIVDVNLLQ